jgi:hypothetical protein
LSTEDREGREVFILNSKGAKQRAETKDQGPKDQGTSEFLQKIAKSAKFLSALFLCYLVVQVAPDA